MLWTQWKQVLKELNRMKMEPMKISTSVKQLSFSLVLATLAGVSFAGCESAKEKPAATATASVAAAPKAPVAPAAPTAPAVPATPSVPAVPAASAQTSAMQAPPVRIKAGYFSSFKDSEGNTWLPDQAFTGGETIERPDLEIANTKDPMIYRAERYSMTGFSYPVPNGKYIVKLHFCETFEGIMGPGERVFSFNVEGHDFKDFDVWAKTGGHQRAYIETVPAEVTDGKLDVTFTPNVENPEINGIEILPGS
jgi:Di-glucose binding within endoplasmic reticulum.